MLPWWLTQKESADSAGHQDSIPGWGRSPAEGNACPLQYSCLENSMNSGTWLARVHGVPKSQTQLSDFRFLSSAIYPFISLLCLTLCDPLDCGPAGSTVLGILQARIMDCVVISSSRGSSRPGDTKPMFHMSPALAGRFFTNSTTWEALFYDGCCCSVAQLCLTVCNPMDCSLPGFPVHHQLPELAQTHIHRVSDAIQPCHPLSSPSSPAFNLSQHQGLFQ